MEFYGIFQPISIAKLKAIETKRSFLNSPLSHINLSYLNEHFLEEAAAFSRRKLIFAAIIIITFLLV